MTKREAKRFVCGIVAASLEGDVSSGAGWIVNDGKFSDEDERKVLAAIREIQDEMLRRAGR